MQCYRSKTTRTTTETSATLPRDAEQPPSDRPANQSGMIGLIGSLHFILSAACWAPWRPTAGPLGVSGAPEVVRRIG